MIEYKNRLGGKKIILVSPDGSITIVENGNQTELTVNKEKIFTLEVSSSPEIDNDKYNNFGLLTDDVTVIYPPQDPGVVKIFYGQFQADVNGQYSVDFGDVVMTGDTEINPYSTYLFEIIGDHGTLKEIKYNGFFGKTINGFSGDHVVVSINGTNTNIDVDSDGWFFKEVQPTTTSIKFNTTDKTNFEKIYLSGVKGNINTAINMFNGCSSLTYIDVSNFNTAAVTSMNNMFYGCSSLTSIDVSNFNTAAVTSMNSMFNGCSLLTSIDVSNFNTAAVTSMNSMFYGCSSLTSIDVSNFSTAAVTSMNSMFNGCSSLTSIDVSNFNTAAVTSVEAMFSGCSSLTSIDVSNFNTAAVTSMNSTFYNCNKLTFIDVSNFNTSKVTSMQAMFRNCSKLTSIDVSNFSTAAVTNMQAMFYDCKLIVNLNIDNFILTVNVNVTSIFTNNISLLTIYLRNSDTTTYDIINAAKPAGATIVTA